MQCEARHYTTTGGIDLYEAAELVVERDGPNLVRIEALGGEEGIVYDLGRPGLSIEMTLDDAISLMERLSEVTMA